MYITLVGYSSPSKQPLLGKKPQASKAEITRELKRENQPILA